MVENRSEDNVLLENRMSECHSIVLNNNKKMETLITLVWKKINGDVSDLIGVTNACRTINDMMDDWMGKYIVLNTVNDNNELMNRDKMGRWR